MTYTAAARTENPLSGWSHGCGEFLWHWRAMRGRGEQMPTSEDFLDHPAAEFVTGSYICEITDAGVIMRFQGADLVDRWGRDFTGRDIHQGMSAAVREWSLSNLHRMIGQPCGGIIRMSYDAPQWRLVEEELIVLPLAVKTGRPPRFVAYVVQGAHRKWDLPPEEVTRTHSAEWVDIGAGVPPDPPISGR